MDPAGLVWIVTGGSSGLGKAVADALVAKQGLVAVLDLNASSDGNKPEDKVAYFQCDVGDEESVKAALEGVKALWKGKKWGGVVHAAGVGMAGKVRAFSVLRKLEHAQWLTLRCTDGRQRRHTLLVRPNAAFSPTLPPAPSPSLSPALRSSDPDVSATSSFDIFQQVHRINLLGSYLIASNVAAVLASQRGPLPRNVTDPSTIKDAGVIILTSSVSATEGQMGQVAYASSKAGVEGLVLPMARDLARYGTSTRSSSLAIRLALSMRRRLTLSAIECSLSSLARAEERADCCGPFPHARAGIRVMNIAPSLFSTAMGKGTSDKCVSLSSAAECSRVRVLTLSLPPPFVRLVLSTSLNPSPHSRS